MARARGAGAQTFTLSAEHPTGNLWIDTGLVVLLERFGEGEHPVDGVLQWLIRELRSDGGGWKYPANRFINTQARPENLTRDIRSQHDGRLG